MYWPIFGIVFFACWAMMVREGIWSNAITLGNILLCGLLAYGLYPPLTIKIDESLEGRYTYFLDFLLIWAIFALAMLISRIVTDKISTTKLRLKHPLDSIGGPLMGALAAWVMATFVMATFHTAPLGEDSLSGKLMHAKEEVATTSAFSAPDLAWLRFVERLTKQEAYGSTSTNDFSAAPFTQFYRDHRAKLDKSASLAVRRTGG